MASARVQHRFSVGLSIAGHAAIVAMLTFSIPLSSRQQAQQAPNVVPIDTFMVDEAVLEAEVARLNAAEEAERQRQREEAERVRREQEEAQRELERIEQERVAAEQAAEQERIRIQQEAERERIRIQQEAEAERVRLAEIERERLEAERIAEEERLERERLEEIARQEELERQRAEEERRRREAEEAARLAAVEAEIQRAIESERMARQAEDAGLRAQWAQAISDKVQLYWNQPPNAGLGLECVMVVTQLPNGDVTDVVIERCNRDDANIIRSIENAVLNASPLPRPPAGVPFERVVRITFRPTD